MTPDITTKGNSNLDSLTTSIHLGSVEQTLTFTAAGSAGPVAVSLQGVSAAGAQAVYSAQVTFATTASTAAAVAAEFVSAINAVSNFTADGNYAVDNGDGTVTIQWASADSIANHAVTLQSAGTTGISFTAGSALPINNTSSEIAAVVASQLNAAFSDNKIFRTASNIAGSSGVTLTFRDSDGAALPTVMASDTTGAFDDFTAANTVTTGNIYVGGVTVSIAPGTTAHNIASAVQTAYKLISPHRQHLNRV